MQNHPGVFIVLEGSDGSGKTTQFRLLTERLKAVGHEVAIFKFPQYDQPSSYFIKQYLAGKYGPSDSISPYTASMFYALDRFEAAPRIKEALKKGKIVISDRYVGANMAHQGAKFTNTHEQRGFFMWAENLEFRVLGIPQPDLNLFLKVLPSMSQQLIAKRAAATGVELDEHEKNQNHLFKAIAAYDLLCKLFPKDFKEINCTVAGQMQSIVEINDLIWEAIKPLLPEPKHRGKGAVVSLDQSNRNENTKPEISQSKNQSKRTTNDKTKFDEILSLQKQMLSKAGSIKGVNHQQLKAAISLATPLIDRKTEIQSLTKEDDTIKSASEDEPVSLDKLIGQISESMPTPAAGEELKLLQAKPRNEFQLLNEAATAGLNYRQKQQQLEREIKNAAAKLLYTFEAISDFNSLLSLKIETAAKEIKLLAASPLLGYKTPDIIEIASLEEPFNKAFAASAELYRKAVSSNDKEAIYNLLLGHNVRFKFTISAADLSKALKASKNQSILNFLGTLRDKISENHPHVARTVVDDESVMP